jgi:hypothetical protein
LSPLPHNTQQKAWSDSRIGKEEDQEDLLAYSMDKRFFLRRVSKDQAKVLVSILSAYYLVPSPLDPFPSKPIAIHWC